MRRAGVAFGSLLMALVAASCISTTAPVVDRPVWDTPAAAPPAPPPAPAARPSAPAQAPRATAERDASNPDWRPDSYTVRGGDTLYSIALDHGLAYRDLAAWNELSDANALRVGQQLTLKPPPGWVERADAEPAQVIARALPSAPAMEVQPLEPPAPVPVKSAPKAVKLAYSEQALAKLRVEPPRATPAGPSTAPLPPLASPQAKPPPAVSAAKPAAEVGAAVPAAKTKVAAASNPQDNAWVWPARGALLHGFNEGPNPKGVAIGGELGQAIVASADGKVVYSGSGLRGYGKLVIIKHDSTYLSVYAHNRTLLVKEGERVTKGQKIAEMGNTDAGRVALHFEIRRLGKPVDPLQYLPGQGAS